MSTALGIITSAMRKCGVLSKGESPSADEAVDGLEMLNDLLASLSNDSMIVYARATESFSVSGGTVSYTIGSGGTFNTARPVRIISAYIRSGGLTDYPLSVVGDEQYSRIVSKSTTGIPEFLNFSNEFPLATIRLYPVPATAYSLVLVTEKPLSSFSLNEEVNLPPGWRRMLVNNLAVEMAPEYGQSVPPEAASIAVESKAQLKASIMASKPLEWVGAAQETGNIYTGWY